MRRRATVALAAVLLAAPLTGCGGDPDVSSAAEVTPTAADDTSGGAPAASDPATGGTTGAAEPSAAPPPPPPPPEALAGDREPAQLPEHWPSEIPLPAGAVVLQAAHPPGGGDSFHLYLRVAGDLATTVDELAGEFGDAGFERPRVEVAAETGTLRTQGHGYRIEVAGRVSDEDIAVLDLTYQVTAA
ncbi:hypothetical protein JQS43_06140 [Natronosporangium hydrolyticum]|uniref:Lipoprotein n=1 Tax=Natronosporangium hydrolyticum TaxID=2811111 RepID=A0A895YP78_9ACTN|nr:hypothetical protein [Natronosporangium hydrolyticum]QSB15910.1 hypothetical protein JQS43_06140 [Natronosporangium hydrolyticum]